MCDYRETISDLLLDGFTKTWHEWAAKQGKLVRNQAHGSPGNLLDLYAAVDIPETEGFGKPGSADSELNEQVEMMYASCAAHVTGKRLASSETCTWLDDHFLTTLGHAKQRVDTTLLAGINHILYHGTPYSPPDQAWPGFLFYAAVEFCPANSWWDDFAALNQYITRCQSFLQAGKPDNDLLVYAPIYDDWMKPGNGTMPHYAVGGHWPGQEIGRELLKAGYTFDFVSDRMLQDVTVSDLQTALWRQYLRCDRFAGNKVHFAGDDGKADELSGTWRECLCAEDAAKRRAGLGQSWKMRRAKLQEVDARLN